MKNLKLKIFFRKIFGSRGKSYKYEEINPRRDWKVAVVAFILISLAVVIFDICVYWKANSGGFFALSNKDEIPIESIDRSELAKTIKFYEAKEKLFQETKIKKPDVVDPSI